MRVASHFAVGIFTRNMHPSFDQRWRLAVRTLRNLRIYQVVAFILALSAHLWFGAAVGKARFVALPERNVSVNLKFVEFPTASNELTDKEEVLAASPAAPLHRTNDKISDVSNSPNNRAPTLVTEKYEAPLPIFEPEIPHYFLAEELTVEPVVLKDVQPPQNPILARLRNQKAVLKLLINEHGDVDVVLVEYSQLTEDAAQILREAFADLKFTPGMIGDVAVKTQITIDVALDDLK